MGTNRTCYTAHVSGSKHIQENVFLFITTKKLSETVLSHLFILFLNSQNTNWAASVILLDFISLIGIMAINSADHFRSRILLHNNGLLLYRICEKYWFLGMNHSDVEISFKVNLYSVLMRVISFLFLKKENRMFYFSNTQWNMSIYSSRKWITSHYCL